MQRFSPFLLVVSLILLSANAIAAETNVCNAGIGGTGIQQDGIGGTGNQQEGIGGTGVQASSGVGGTGAQVNSGVGGTGIVGIITGFASICVNGLELHYNAHTSVDVDGVSSTIEALNIGQLVAVESAGESNLLMAKHVSVSHLMVGKIEKIDAAQNSIQIMGQPVYISQNTINGTNLKPNQTVKVSGLLATNNTIHALRIDLATADTPSQVAGLIDENNAVGGIRIMGANTAANGEIVRVSGRWDGSELHASEIKESALQRVLNKSENLVIQGIAPTNTEQRLVLQNQIVKTDSNTTISGAHTGNNKTIIVRGKSDRAGKITARTIEYSGEDTILERGGSKHRPSSLDKKGERIENGRGANSKKEAKDRSESAERHENTVRPEKVDKPEKAERPERAERSERTERAEKAERPEKVERPERAERPERSERYEVRED
jgi:hypothetical protein